MMAQNKHRDKIEELVEHWAREIISGTQVGSLPPHSSTITGMDDIATPQNWNPTQNRLPFGISHHLLVSDASDFALSGGELTIRRAMQSVFERMNARANPIDSKVDGLSDRMKASAENGEIFIVVADANIQRPDRVMKAISSCRTKPTLGLILLDTTNGNAASFAPEKWLTERNLHQKNFGHSFIAGHVRVSAPSSLQADIDLLLQKLRGEALQSMTSAIAKDDQAVANAEKNGIQILSRPVVAGPTKEQ